MIMSIKAEHDITCEEWREYDLGDRVYRVQSPKTLFVGDTTHRVVDIFGQVHCVPFPKAGQTTVVLRWQNKVEHPAVKF
jgi:hypothetical protein